MSASDPKLTSMEDSHAVEDERGIFLKVPFLVPPASIPSSAPPFPTTTTPNFTSETVIESKAVSVASNDCSSALSSPAEASPAKPAVTSTFEGPVETSPATSRMASASDSLTCTGTSLVDISQLQPLLFALPSSTFGQADLDNDFPAVLTFKGVSVTLENNSVWKQFHSCGTEMILTKHGRRMFPYCRYRLSGLDPERQYSLVLSIVPVGQYKYRWSACKWEANGHSEHHMPGVMRAFSHHYSPSPGAAWMNGLVSFYKLKLTNNNQDSDGHVILHSMHRYIPRLHVIPVLDGEVPTSDQPVVKGPEGMTFTFPQMEFMAVTTYQNFRITQLKINHNPFAKGFREDGNNSRLNRVTTEVKAATDTDAPLPAVNKPSEDREEEVLDLSPKNHSVPAALTNTPEPRLVLKPIMSNPAGRDEPYVPCMRGKHALGELVLVEAKEENDEIGVTPKTQQGFKGWMVPRARSLTPTSPASTPILSPLFRKRRKRINRRWANSRGREWKAAAASPTTIHSPSLTVAMQPELDDVEGLLFVSFTSEEALEVHVRDKPTRSSSSASPVSLTTLRPPTEKREVNPMTDEEKIAHSEVTLLSDLRVLKHRQVIHPVLQEVGLKLSSLGRTKSIDLQYLGVGLPLPPPNLPEQKSTAPLSPADEGLPFISRTGKTSDVTKIKGWRNKFIRSKEASPTKCEGLQKNLSAFCSNMLDEYLESEAQRISERAAAFSTNPEGSVVYQLPAKSSSYVKTLDSALKHRNTASKVPAGANRPCPLSHKPLLYSALTSPPPPLAGPAPPSRTEAHSHPAAAAPGSSLTSDSSQRFSTNHMRVSPRPAVSFGQSPAVPHRPTGLTKVQHRLMQMEVEAQNQGLSRTQLTPDRLSVALSVLLTKEMLSPHILKAPLLPKNIAGGPECGQQFCRLGCVCSSLQHLDRGPLHCRRPECMFGCACFKRKITKQMAPGESEPQTPPVYSMTNMEHAVQPRPGSHVNKLWNRDIHDVDPEPLSAPRSAPVCAAPQKFLKRGVLPRPTPPIREEDKDPVYKYLESMMTCARVREFNSKSPPEVAPDLPTPLATAPNTTADPQKIINTLPETHGSAALTEKMSQKTASSESEAKKQIQIQSACNWKKDQQMVLEALCERMNQNQLSQLFHVGPYCIRPVSKICIRKPSGAIVTYRVLISKPSKASDYDEDESDDSDEERHHLDGDTDREEEEEDKEEEDDQTDVPQMSFGVTPFLSGVVPAGKLRAQRKPAGSQAQGFVQVNGKSYNQARLVLGNMGCLHPANRLAAYVTGRLPVPSSIIHKNSQTADTMHKINTPAALHIKPAGTAVPPIITARKTTDLKAPARPPVHSFQPPGSWRKGPITASQRSQSSSIITPLQSFISSQLTSFQNSSTSSPVSLTVSPSLKSPSFLGQNGTYSFRICPPSNQGANGQKLPGVTLPGGFTLIQLPKPGANGAAQQSDPVKTTNSTGDGRPLKDSVFSFSQLAAEWLGLGSIMEAKSLSRRKPAEPGSDESAEASSKQEDSNLDNASEDLSSDFSDYCGEGDEEDEPIDIETVEEVEQGKVIMKMKEAAFKESRGSSDGFESLRTDTENDSVRRRKNHTALERQRRTEQRVLFDKLQGVLRSHHGAPRLRLLSLALKEIQHLKETSKCLEEKKEKLTQLQSVYVEKLSRLSGKSEKLIIHKLKEICERQKIREKKMKWRPFFSNLLQSKAALLQATAPQSKLPSSPLLQPDRMAPTQAKTQTTPTPSNLQMMLSLLQPYPQKATGRSCVNTPTSRPHSSPRPPSQVEVEPGEPAASVQDSPAKLEQQEASEDPDPVTLENCKIENQPEAPSLTPPRTTAQCKDSAAPTAPSSTQPPAPPAPQFALPLIRSKTGRIILPSSLKPIGQGFYTLMFMDKKQTGEEGEAGAAADSQPSDVVSSKNQEQPSASETRRSVEDKTASSEPGPKCSGVTAPLTELTLLNKSIFVPLVDLKAVKRSQEGATGAALNTTEAAVHLSFNRVREILPSVMSEPDAAVHRSRGRPRKNLVSENEKRAVVDESGTKTLKGIKRKAEDTPGKGSEGADNPATVKRGRGRPPRKRRVKRRSPPLRRRARSPSNEDSPGTKAKKNPVDASASRPLTRGALGKDFPSAKKRSWIDVEKELEPELESE